MVLATSKPTEAYALALEALVAAAEAEEAEFIALSSEAVALAAASFTAFSTSTELP